MNEKIIAYIERLQQRIAMLRTPAEGVESPADVRVALEAVADSLDGVVRELTDLLEIHAPERIDRAVQASTKRPRAAKVFAKNSPPRGAKKPRRAGRSSSKP